jgi:hydrogenase nickel incorporation protein HypA/HybF
LHEFSATTQIVELVLHEAKSRGAEKVLEVVVQIGKMTLLSPDQVEFAYKLLTEKTIADGSILTIEDIPGKVRCSSCGYEGTFDVPRDADPHSLPISFSCNRCGGPVDILDGNHWTVKSIRMLGPTAQVEP